MSLLIVLLIHLKAPFGNHLTLIIMDLENLKIILWKLYDYVFLNKISGKVCSCKWNSNKFLKLCVVCLNFLVSARFMEIPLILETCASLACIAV
jgi:hypothetical protein